MTPQRGRHPAGLEAAAQILDQADGGVHLLDAGGAGDLLAAIAPQPRVRDVGELRHERLDLGGKPRILAPQARDRAFALEQEEVIHLRPP